MQDTDRSANKTEISVRVTMPIELHKTLQQKAISNRRQLREEIIQRLTCSLKYEDIWMETEQLLQRIFNKS